MTTEVVFQDEQVKNLGFGQIIAQAQPRDRDKTQSRILDFLDQEGYLLPKQFADASAPFKAHFLTFSFI